MIRKMLAVTAAVVVAAAVFAATPLDGKTFTGDLLEKGKDKADADTFVFKDGKFRSVACDAYGFGDAPYTVSQDHGKTVFSAVTKNTKGDEMHWQGTVDGTSISGTVRMVSGGKDATSFTFKGSAKS